MSTIRDADLVRTNDYADETGEVRVLDPDGRVLPGARVPDLSDDGFETLYEAMVEARRFDERAVSWQRQGRIATYAPMSGQEGAQVASTLALTDDDWVFPTYREHAVRRAAGFELTDVLRGLMGVELPAGRAGGWNVAESDETGTTVAESDETGTTGPTVFPEAVPIATQLPHATGAAMAARYDDAETVALAHFGDGATSEGDFHEGLNFAGVFDAPAVFFCNNNQYAISHPVERQTASATIAGKADAYGFAGVQVDGMDPLAVYQVTREAVEKARDPDPDADELRPTLVEAVMYRFGAHTTADDPSVYRTDEEVERWKERDPIRRMERFLRERGLLDDEAVDAIEAANRETVADLIERAEAYVPDVDEWFENAYETPTPRVREQQDYLRDLRERHGDDALVRDE